MDTRKESDHNSDDISFSTSGNRYLRKSAHPEICASGNPYPRKSIHLKIRTSGQQYFTENHASDPEGGVQYSATTYFVCKNIVLYRVERLDPRFQSGADLGASFFCQYDLACATKKVGDCSISNNQTLEYSISCFVYTHLSIDFL